MTQPARDAASPTAPNPLKRRGVLLGAAAAAGAATVATQLLPRGATEAVAAAAPAGTPSTSAGYRLTEHVKRYYETTRA